MKTNPRSLLAAFLLVGCAPDPPSTIEPERPSAGAAAAPADAATPEPTTARTEPTSPPEVVPPPEPEPPPPANATPAELRLAVYGRCKYLGVSRVDDQTFLHYQHPSTYNTLGSMVHRIDEHGGVAETIRFKPGGPGFNTQLQLIFGHWPDSLYARSFEEGRMEDDGYLFRRADGEWLQIEPPGGSGDYWDAWVWHDGSLLAWADLAAYDEPSKPRLQVVRGAGKGPSLTKLQSRSRCEEGDFHLRDVHVQPDGKVLALATCGGTWIATWTPDDLEGTTQRVASDDGWSDASLHIDASGKGYILLESGLFAWDGTTATRVRTPKGRAPKRAFLGRDGETWILQGGKPLRRTADDWEPVAVPEGSPVTFVAGLEHGTPWLLHKDGTVSMQTTDGAWHPVPLPPTPDLDKVPKATTLYVLAPGDAWIEGTYFKMSKGSKHIGKPFWAAFTTRDAPTALDCATEPDRQPADTATPKSPS